MRQKNEIDDNIQTILADTSLTDQDKTLLADYTKKAMTRKPIKDMKIE